MNILPTSHTLIELEIASEHLRQARQSFNLALTTTIISFSLSVVGAVLLLSDKMPEGAVTSLGGLASSARSIQFAKDAKKRLDRILNESYKGVLYRNPRKGGF